MYFVSINHDYLFCVGSFNMGIKCKLTPKYSLAWEFSVRKGKGMQQSYSESGLLSIDNSYDIS